MFYLKPEDDEEIPTSCTNDQVREDSVIPAKPPSGKFILDVHKSIPAVLVSNGVGITPMIFPGDRRTDSYQKGCMVNAPPRSLLRVAVNSKVKLQPHFSYCRVSAVLTATALEPENIHP